MIDQAGAETGALSQRVEELERRLRFAERENEQLREAIGGTGPEVEVVAESEAMQAVVDQATEREVRHPGQADQRHAGPVARPRAS